MGRTRKDTKYLDTKPQTVNQNLLRIGNKGVYKEDGTNEKRKTLKSMYMKSDKLLKGVEKLRDKTKKGGK